MFINLAGWIMQLNFFLYVKRNWREDQINLSQFVDYYQKLNYDCRLVLFPEGTDLSEENRRRSDKYAQANNIQVFKIFLSFHLCSPCLLGLPADWYLYTYSGPAKELESERDDL